MAYVDQNSVLIVDDHPALAYGAKLCLINSQRIDVVEIVTTGCAAIDAVERLLPHVVILDLHLPDMNGIDVAQSIRDMSDAHIIIYTGDDNYMEYFPRLIALHISGIVHKKYPIEYLVHAAECALNGYAAIPLDVFHTLTIASHVSEPLVEREMNILRLLDKGYTNQEIADELYVSPKTIENYLTRIYKKLSAGSRYEAVKKFRTLNRH